MAADILVAFVMRQHNCQQDCEEMYLNKRGAILQEGSMAILIEVKGR